MQYVVLGAFIHGGLAALFACPLAMRVLDLPVWHEGESLWEICGAVILVFFVVAGVARLLAESWWQGLFSFSLASQTILHAARALYNVPL